MIHYSLPGDRAYLERIYTAPAELDPQVRRTLGLDSRELVIAHFTASSLAQDGIDVVPGSLRVTRRPRGAGYAICFQPAPGFEGPAEQFAAMHVAMLDTRHAGLALNGVDACRRTPAWNPMAAYPVNATDGPCTWLPCLPLGMPVAHHRAVTLLHYPPIVALRKADYLDNMTLRRWAQVLRCAGVQQPERYHAILDVNPIAAPGSGQSEYANDYFPVNLTSMFFANRRRGLNYVPAMLELMLNPPSNADNPQTLPLLVCGSPLYDPQAAGWFRTHYKDQLPRDANGTPSAKVLQVGLVKISPRSSKPTPYMVANHMIAAGVTGRCTDDASKVPDIRTYEAQDLVAASFLAQYAAAQGRTLDPFQARRAAYRRWFGNDDGSGAPVPHEAADRLAICALAQMDLCFDAVKIAPMYSYAQALERCQRTGGEAGNPCFGCAPISPSAGPSPASRPAADRSGGAGRAR